MLSPRIDFVFKKLFGSEDNKDILIEFINAIVSEEDQVVDVTIHNPYNDKEFPQDKISILDIKAIDTQGRQYNIEMQLDDQAAYQKRALYYWAKLFVSQLHSGKSFLDLKKTIHISVLNFEHLPREPHYHTVCKMLSTATHEQYLPEIEFHFIELPKFNDEAMPLKTALDRWVTFLRKADAFGEKGLPVPLTQAPGIEKAFSSLSTMSLDPKERKLYEARLKFFTEQHTMIEAALIEGKEEGKEEGMKKGIEKGMAKGREEGREEGLEEGMGKGVEKVAITMLENNLSFELIEQATGLAVAKIEALKERIKTRK